MFKISWTRLTCSWIWFKRFVSWETLTGFIISVHEEIVSTDSVGEIIAVVVSEAGVSESDNLPDGIITTPGLRYPHVTLLTPARLQYLVTFLPLFEWQSSGAWIQAWIDWHGLANSLREVHTVLVANTGVFVVKSRHVAVDSECGGRS